MDEIIVKVFSRYKLEALCELLTNENIAFGRLNNAKQLASHPHLRKTQVQLPNGDMIDLISPPSQFNSEKSVLGSVPSLGQHTDSIKQEFFSDKGDVLERI
jgi:itaconate CoA-transferase